MNDPMPIKYWGKFQEAALHHEKGAPYFSLMTLWSKVHFDYENGAKEVVEARPYFYSLS